VLGVRELDYRALAPSLPRRG